jgi:hypothetical protein
VRRAGSFALLLATTKMDNNFKVVDAVAKKHGGTATLFVKAGNEYVRVATNVKKANGSRATGTILDPLLGPKPTLEVRLPWILATVMIEELAGVGRP